MCARHVEALARVDRQRDVADQVGDEDEHEDRGDQREVLALHLRIQVFLGDAAHEVVEHLHCHLQTPGALLQAPGDVEHHPERDPDCQQQVENGLVEGDRPDLEPGVEFELVGRREDAAGDVRRLVRRDPEQDHEQDDPADPQAEHPVEDLPPWVIPCFSDGGAGGVAMPAGIRGASATALIARSPPRPLNIRVAKATEYAREDGQRRREPVGAPADGARNDDRPRQQPDSTERLGDVEPEPRARLALPRYPAPVGVREARAAPAMRPRDQQAERRRAERQRHGRGEHHEHDVEVLQQLQRRSGDDRARAGMAQGRGHWFWLVIGHGSWLAPYRRKSQARPPAANSHPDPPLTVCGSRAESTLSGT